MDDRGGCNAIPTRTLALALAYTKLRRVRFALAVRRPHAGGTEVLPMIATAALVALAAFLAGLLTFKIKQRWCPTCGALLTCPDPTYHSDLPRERRPEHDSRRNTAPESARRTPTPRRANAVRRAGEGARQRNRAI